MDNINSGLVVNQTNALNLPLKERKLLLQPNLWHKIIVHNAVAYRKEEILNILVNFTQPLDFIPVDYKMVENNAHFIVRNCTAAIEKLCRENLIIQNPKGRPIVLSAVIGFAHKNDIPLDINKCVINAINKRYDKKTGTIDLERFYNDTELNSLVYCSLTNSKFLHFVLHFCKSFNPKILKLGYNELKTVSSLEALHICKSLVHLDLRHNLIENMISLSCLKLTQIKELWLDGNPVCQNYDENGYIEAVKEICPSVTKLDGVLLGVDGFLAYRRNFSISKDAVGLIDQFLEHFFTMYDSKDRSCLQAIYDTNAMFTLTCCYISRQTTSSSARLENYRIHSRNLLKMCDFSKTYKQVEIGPEAIIKKLCQLPASEHDPYTFTVDILDYTEEQVMFMVTGAFREPAENLNDSEGVYYFCRTFILSPKPNGEYKVVNEMYHVSNATTSLVSRAFKIVKVAKPKITTMLKEAHTEFEKEEFIFCVSSVTNLNREWSKRYLEDAKWNLQHALELFVDQYKLDRIPQTVFISDQTLENMKLKRSKEVHDNKTTVDHKLPPLLKSSSLDRLADKSSVDSPEDYQSISSNGPDPEVTKSEDESTCTRIPVPRPGGGVQWSTIYAPASLEIPKKKNRNRRRARKH